ncbi:MAG: hypothetical protein K2G89_02370 [Lachnospiraceae bacterium]|nr:hypothetical protein [Lachnospiraceae bacterium]
MQKNKKTYFYITLTLMFALAGILVPGIILTRKNNAIVNHAATLSKNYYSGTTSTISRNASAQLSTYQKMELISGAWESNTLTVEPEESTLTEYEAVNLALESLYELYQHGNYPSELSPSFKNWCTWTATLYKATDSSFHTYCAYYWKLVFDKYDASETHTAFIMEDGTLLCAYTNLNHNLPGTISHYMKNESSQKSRCSIIKYDGALSKLPLYPDVELPGERPYIRDASIMVVGSTNLRSLNDVKEAYENLDNQYEYYYIYQILADEAYMYSIIPYQP